MFRIRRPLAELCLRALLALAIVLSGALPASSGLAGSTVHEISAKRPDAHRAGTPATDEHRASAHAAARHGSSAAHRHTETPGRPGTSLAATTSEPCIHAALTAEGPATGSASEGSPAPAVPHHHDASADCCLSFCFSGVLTEHVALASAGPAAIPAGDVSTLLVSQPPHGTERPPRA